MGILGPGGSFYPSNTLDRILERTNSCTDPPLLYTEPARTGGYVRVFEQKRVLRLVVCINWLHR